LQQLETLSLQKTVVSIKAVTQYHFLVVFGGKVIVVSLQYNNKKQLL